jgi:pyruvate,water dikinase
VPPPVAVHARPDPSATLREALRLRIRWVQELSGRGAWVLGRRLAERGVLDTPEQVRHLRSTSLEALVTGRAVLWQVGSDRSVHEPLPHRFRLSAAGEVVAVDVHPDRAGTGAGGGVATGTVTHDRDDLPPDAVLVVATLDPGLAPVVHRLRGLVSETGSPLAHLAILAREAGVAVVVGAAGCRDRLAPGTRVRVDGLTGEVSESSDRRSRT